MPTYMLTESDRLLVAQALRERGLHLRENIDPIITPPLPLVIHDRLLKTTP